MHRLKVYLRETLPEGATDDAETLLSRLLPVAFQLLRYKSDPWPFCEAVDELGKLQFFPNVWARNQLIRVSAAELEECLRLGILAGNYRSVGLAELLWSDRSDGTRNLNIELFLARRVSVTMTVPLRAGPEIWIGSPFVMMSPRGDWNGYQESQPREC